MRISSIPELRTQLFSMLKGASHSAIVTHKDPDGDGFAAALALQRILILFNYNVPIILNEPAPAVYDYLQGSRSSFVWNNELAYDLLIFLDCHEQKRIGACGALVEKAKQIITIDHHDQYNPIPESWNYLDPQEVSVGIIIYEMFKDGLKTFPPLERQYIIDCIYTTILNDTDNFTNANSKPKAYEVSQELISLGLKPWEIYAAFFQNKPYTETRFLGEVLSTVEVYFEEKVLFMHSTLDMLAHNNLNQDATSKLTRWVKGVRNNQVIVYFREIAHGRYRLSLRSETVNVLKIAQKHDGGGHLKAAGCELLGSLEEVKSIIIEDLKEQI